MSEHIIKALLEQNDELKERVADLEAFAVKLIHKFSQDPAEIENLKGKIGQIESDMKSLVDNQ